jgi:hypothetical protein
MPKTFQQFLELSLSQQAVIDKYACETVFYRLMNDQRRYQRIDTAAQATDNSFFSDMITNFLDLPLDERAHFPFSFQAGFPKKKIREKLQTLLGVNNFWMELNAKDLLFLRFNHSRMAIGGLSRDKESRWGIMNLVPVAHPDLSPILDTGEQSFSVFHFQVGKTIFPFFRRFDLPP